MKKSLTSITLIMVALSMVTISCNNNPKETPDSEIKVVEPSPEQVAKLQHIQDSINIYQDSVSAHMKAIEEEERKAREARLAKYAGRYYISYNDRALNDGSKEYINLKKDGSATWSWSGSNKFGSWSISEDGKELTNKIRLNSGGYSTQIYSIKGGKIIYLRDAEGFNAEPHRLVKQ